MAHLLAGRCHTAGAGKPFAHLHRGKQQPAGEAQLEREGEGRPSRASSLAITE